VGLPPSAGLAAGTLNTCSTGADLSLECWGYNGFGELGTGNQNPSFVPMPVKL
jgi:hypothetical protein